MRAEYRKHVYDNGLTLVGERHPQVRGLSLGAWVRVGSGQESPSQSGICHVIEHMLFKGTETRDPKEIALALESLGGDLNAFTDREYTCYHATVLSEHIESALDVVSDIVLHPVFPAAELQKEKKVLVQEMSMVEETPEDWIHTLFMQNVWKGDSMGQPIMGNRKTVREMTRAKLLKFYKQYYSPENVVISVAGEFDFDRLVDRVAHYFQFPTSQNSLPLKKKPPTYQARRACRVMDTEQLHLLIGFEGHSFFDADRFDHLVLSYLLGGGMSSRLFQEVREKHGLAYSVDCDATPYSNSGLFTIYAATGHRYLKKVMGIIAKELDLLKREKIAEERLEEIKSQLRGSILLSSDHMETRMESVGRNELTFGKYLSLEDIISEIDQVTPDRLIESARNTFTRSKQSTMVVSRQKFKSNQLQVLV